MLGEIVHREEHGGDTVKFLNSEDVSAAFSQAERDSGWIKPGLVRFGNCEQGAWLVYYYRPTRWLIGTAGNKYFVPTPALMLFSVGRDHFLFALKTKTNEFDITASLFHAPFPNIHSNGKICWGKNAAPETDHLKPDAPIMLFFRTPFNHDLADGKSRSDKKDVLNTLEKLSHEQSFPLRDLVPMKETVDELIERTLKHGI